MTPGTFVETLERKETAQPKGRKAGIALLLIFAALVLAGLAIYGIFIRNRSTTELQQRSNDAAEMVVSVVHPESAALSVALKLPGQTRAYIEAPIFAQTTGYLKTWNFDIGARIKAGEVLAEIDTPQVDQQYRQAQAQLKVAEAARDLAEATLKRDQDLFNRKVISAQDFDTASDSARQTEATVVADRASVSALQALEDFKTVKAPFDGVVTERDTDIGGYVAAGTATQLFRMAQTAPLRVYVNVPQTFARFIKPGTPADLTLNELPDRKFPAKVTSTAGAIDPASRTLLTELEVPNDKGELLPGSYAQITLKLNGDSGKFVIPSNSLLFRSEGPAVGLVHPDGKVEIRKIVIDRDLGDRLQVAEGLSGTDQVIVNPSDGLADGISVKIAKQPVKESAKAEGTK